MQCPPTDWKKNLTQNESTPSPAHKTEKSQATSKSYTHLRHQTSIITRNYHARLVVITSYRYLSIFLIGIICITSFYFRLLTLCFLLQVRYNLQAISTCITVFFQWNALRPSTASKLALVTFATWNRIDNSIVRAINYKKKILVWICCLIIFNIIFSNAYSQTQRLGI